MAEINNFIPRGNDFGLEVRLNTKVGDNPPEAYDLTGATDVRLALVGHGMHVFAKDVEVSDTNLISGTIPGRALLLGLYGLEVTCVLDHKNKRFAVNDIIEVVDEIPADSDDTAEGEGGGLQVTITVVQTVLTITGPAGADGQPGAPGQNGQDGQDGADGFSPTASVSKSGKVATISITDKNGTTTTTVSDGEDGQDGQDGAPGQDGSDGYSPTITVTDITGGHRLTITDKDGSRTVDVMNGQNGQNGTNGTNGQDGQSAVRSLVTHTSSETSVTGLAWDSVHKWPEISGLTFTLATAPSDGVEHEVVLVFDTPTDASNFTLNYDSSILWGNNDNPASAIANSTRYEIHINSASMIAVYTVASIPSNS